MSDTYVQVRGCYEDVDGYVVWANTESAEFFGVYVGRPGSFVWQADEPTREEALRRAEAIAESRGIPPENVVEA